MPRRRCRPPSDRRRREPGRPGPSSGPASRQPSSPRTTKPFTSSRPSARTVSRTCSRLRRAMRSTPTGVTAGTCSSTVRSTGLSRSRGRSGATRLLEEMRTDLADRPRAPRSPGDHRGPATSQVLVDAHGGVARDRSGHAHHGSTHLLGPRRVERAAAQGGLDQHRAPGERRDQPVARQEPQPGGPEPGGCSETTANSDTRWSSRCAVLHRVHPVHAAGQHRDGGSARQQGRVVGDVVDAEGATGHDGHRLHARCPAMAWVISTP